MASVTVEFSGICTHVQFDQLGTELPPYGRRVVLPNGNPHAIENNPNLKDLVGAHYARLSVPIQSDISGPAADLFYPVADGNESRLMLNLNIVGFKAAGVDAPPGIGLTGATVQLVGGLEPLSVTAAQCLPQLAASLGFTPTPSPVVFNKNSPTVSAYFDMTAGTLAGFTVPLIERAFAQLTATTIGRAQILITPWNGTAPTLVTLPEDPELSNAIIINEPFVFEFESDNDFLLHFVVTADEFPTLNALNTSSGCPSNGPIHHWEAGPGCSNSGIP